jgi:hypothetical protein
MMRARQKPGEGSRIEKPEDREWCEWYNKLDVKEHEKMLAQLGLDKEDIEEWEETSGYKKAKKKE